MPPQRSPLALVAIVTVAAALLLALTLPDKEPRVVPCPVGVVARKFDCGIRVDHRVPERVTIVVAGVAIAIALVAASRRFDRQRAGGTPPSR